MSDYHELIEVIWDAIEETTRAPVDRSRVEIDLGALGITEGRTDLLRTIIGARIRFPFAGAADELQIEPDTPVMALAGDIAGKGGTRPR